MSSVLKPWVMGMPWKMQSILLSGVRAPDVKSSATKRICRWMRSEAMNNADPKKVDGFMHFDNPVHAQPVGIGEKSVVEICISELEYMPCHYVHHFADALAVISCYHPQTAEQIFARRVHELVATEIFHFIPETWEQFVHRHRDRVEHD